jgi:hypothetical protein
MRCVCRVCPCCFQRGGPVTVQIRPSQVPVPHYGLLDEIPDHDAALLPSAHITT